MTTLAKIGAFGLLTLVTTATSAVAQGAVGAEARLVELNITLPQVNPPAGNYVDAVQVGKLLFLAGNTMGPKPKFKGQISKEVTVKEGYESARLVGLLMLA